MTDRTPSRGKTTGSHKGKAGVHGYIKASIAIIGPNDKIVHHNLEKDLKREEVANMNGTVGDLCMMPPSVDMGVRFLVVGVHTVSQLPPMDTNRVSGMLKKGNQSGIDAQVKLCVGDKKPVATPVYTLAGDREKLYKKFNRELWLPLPSPSMTDHFTVEVWDEDNLQDQLVSTVSQSMKLIEKLPDHSLEPRWYNLYGAAIEAQSGSDKMGLDLNSSTDKVIQQMNSNPDLGTTYRGKILLSFRIEESDGDDAMKVRECCSHYYYHH